MPSVKEISENDDLSKLTVGESDTALKSPSKKTSEKSESPLEECGSQSDTTEVSQSAEGSDATLLESTACSKSVAHFETSMASKEDVALKQAVLPESTSTSELIVVSELNISSKSGIPSKTTVVSESAVDCSVAATPELVTPDETNVAPGTDVSKPSAESQLSAASDESSLVERILSSKPAAVAESNVSSETGLVPESAGKTESVVESDTSVVMHESAEIIQPAVVSESVAISESLKECELTAAHKSEEVAQPNPSPKPAMASEASAVPESTEAFKLAAFSESAAKSEQVAACESSENLKPAIAEERAAATADPVEVPASTTVSGTDIFKYQPSELDSLTAQCEDIKRRMAENLVKEQEAKLYGGQIKRRVTISGPNRKAKIIEPSIVTERRFRILFDVSKFDIENLSVNIIGDKIDIFGKQENFNQFGEEFYEIHQIFRIPEFVDDSNLTACITENDVLFLDAPLKIKEDAA